MRILPLEEIEKISAKVGDSYWIEGYGGEVLTNTTWEEGSGDLVLDVEADDVTKARLIESLQNDVLRLLEHIEASKQKRAKLATELNDLM